MKFEAFRTQYSFYSKSQRQNYGNSEMQQLCDLYHEHIKEIDDKNYDALSADERERKMFLCHNGQAHRAGIVAKWIEEQRPYYRLYPFIEQAICELDLRKVQEKYLKIPEVALSIETASKTPAFMIGYAPNTNAGPGRTNEIYMMESYEGDDHIPRIASLRIEKGMTFYDLVKTCTDYDPIFERYAQIAIGISLLGEDSELIEPVISKRYESQYQIAKAAGDQAEIDRLTEKSAKLAGSLGFTIGKNIESVPHIRRPHPALYWTGPGRMTPKIVLRKGSVVNRKSYKQVPTGYHEKEANSNADTRSRT